jgi:hypothetical protein
MSILNAEEKKSSHCETWPATVVLHSNQDIWRDQSEYSLSTTSTLAQNMKAVYVPHPIYFGHQWDPSQLYSRLSQSDLYKKVKEKILRDASFYYDAAYARIYYKEWMTSRDLCMAPVLLHPVKRMFVSESLV